MPAVKGSGQSVIASTAASATSAVQDASTNYATEAFIDLVQVGTATTPATLQIQVSADGGTTYYSPSAFLLTFPVAAGTYDYVLQLPITATKWKAVFVQQAGGTSSTIIVQSNNVVGV